VARTLSSAFINGRAGPLRASAEMVARSLATKLRNYSLDASSVSPRRSNDR